MKYKFLSFSFSTLSFSYQLSSTTFILRVYFQYSYPCLLLCYFVYNLPQFLYLPLTHSKIINHVLTLWQKIGSFFKTRSKYTAANCIYWCWNIVLWYEFVHSIEDLKTRMQRIMLGGSSMYAVVYWNYLKYENLVSASRKNVWEVFQLIMLECNEREWLTAGSPNKQRRSLLIDL